MDSYKLAVHKSCKMVIIKNENIFEIAFFKKALWYQIFLLILVCFFLFV